MGCACAIVLTTFGASYGTAKSANAIFSSGILRPDRLMQNTHVKSLPKSRFVLLKCSLRAGGSVILKTEQ
jgi:hypothetical protein